MLSALRALSCPSSRRTWNLEEENNVSQQGLFISNGNGDNAIVELVAKPKFQ